MSTPQDSSSTRPKSDWELEEERERAQVEAERMEIYEGGPLPDANFFDDPQ